MNKKIDELVREEIRTLCLNELTWEIINQENRNKAKLITLAFLLENGYNINYVKCDYENNPPSIVDSGHVEIMISEKEASNPETSIIHTIIL